MKIRARTLAGFIFKEFTQIFRDPKMIVALFFIPLMQLVMFGLALTSEVKNIELKCRRARWLRVGLKMPNK